MTNYLLLRKESSLLSTSVDPNVGHMVEPTVVVTPPEGVKIFMPGISTLLLENSNIKFPSSQHMCPFHFTGALYK